MVDISRPTSATQVLQGRESTVVQNANALMQTIGTTDRHTQTIQIEGLPIIPERFYRPGDQTPSNRYFKHADTVMLPRYESQEERDTAAQPFYRQRREAFSRLHRQRGARLRHGTDDMLCYSGISWKPEGSLDTATRVMPIVAAFEGLERFLAYQNAPNPVERTRIRAEYEPHQSVDQGAKIWFSVTSASGQGHYRMRESSIENVAVFNTEQMYSIMAGLKTTPNCAHKQNMRTLFKRWRDGTKLVEPFCQHDVEAMIATLALYQQKLRANEEVDTVYDPLERTSASVPMFLNPVPLATPNELHDYRVLAQDLTLA